MAPDAHHDWGCILSREVDARDNTWRIGVTRFDLHAMQSTFRVDNRTIAYYPVHALSPHLATPLERLPATVKILLENVLRHATGGLFSADGIANLRVVPPGTGIVHQVNLEYLAQVVSVQTAAGLELAYPDTLVGTDSHTTMVNGMGVLGWGVGGIEAEAVLLGEPTYLTVPEVVGVRLTGRLREGGTATDLVLTRNQLLRTLRVVAKFVEFYGPSVQALALPDRATIANMAPEYGATAALFPIDTETLTYLRLTGRPEAHVRVVEAYARAQGLFHTPTEMEPVFDQVAELDLSTVETSLAGPRRPQDRVPLPQTSRSFRVAFAEQLAPSAGKSATATAVAERPPVVQLQVDGHAATLTHGAVVIAAITSCTNTSNPEVMVAAGLLPKETGERGLRRHPAAKTAR